MRIRNIILASAATGALVVLSGCFDYYRSAPYREPPGMLAGEMTQYRMQQRMGRDPTPPPALVGDSSIDDNTRWKLQHIQ